MVVYYRRVKPGSRENLGAGLAAFGAAAGVAAVTFYLVRLFLAREPMDSRPPGPARNEPSGPDRNSRTHRED